MNFTGGGYIKELSREKNFKRTTGTPQADVSSENSLL